MASNTNSRPLWSVRHLFLNIGMQTIFDDADFSVHENEHVALVGRNGCGKSTLLRIIAGEFANVRGDIAIANNLRIGYLPQNFAVDSSRTVRENILDGTAYWIDLLKKYEDKRTPLQEHERIEHLLNMHDSWDVMRKAENVISKFNLDGARMCEGLSGGEMRKVALARAIVASPDLLLLDEPTNHLDVTVIRGIEKFLDSFRGSCLFVTHDRYFLDRLADRVVELDQGKFYSYDGSYADFMAGKMERETKLSIAEEKRKHFLAKEIDWIRRSPKARLKRNLGRVKRFDELNAVQDIKIAADMELLIPDPPRLGNKAVDAENISLSFGDKILFKNFSFEFVPGSKVGIIGPNGIGKSSFLKVLTGQLEPDTGKIKYAPALEFNYIDQGKVTLDLEKTVAEEISGGVETIDLGTEKISVWGYLKRFLFEDERINTQVKYLSGGEKARLILAKILKNRCNFLILDEPTNDLDLSSLRMLEDALESFGGALLIVSHDRYFLNRLCDTIIAFEGDGEIYVQTGDYDYYLEKFEEREAKKLAAAAPKVKPMPIPAAPVAPKAEKLSFKENRELEEMEGKIEELDEKISEIEALFSAPDFFEKHGKDSPKLQAELEDLKNQQAALYERWEYLEQKKERCRK